MCKCVCIYARARVCMYLSLFAHSAEAVEYTNCASARDKNPNECPGYETKRSDGEVAVMLKIWGMWKTLSLPMFPDPLEPRVVVPDRVLSMD